jgi:hypothetical protein
MTIGTGLNITSAAAPGSVSLGGVMAIKSGRQLIDEERSRAEEANSAPIVQGLASHIRACWTSARLAKEQTVEPRMVQSIRQRRGQYDPDKISAIAQQGGAQIYMMLTSNKCRSAGSWLRDVLLTTSKNKPWSIAPAQQPDIAPDQLQQIMQQAAQTIQQMTAGGNPPSNGDVRQLLLNAKDEAMAHVKDVARQAADRMESKMQDQLAEGGFLTAFSDFIDDVTTFPAAFLKGPVVRNKPKLEWVSGPNGTYTPDVKDQLVLEWERVDPFHLYPAADASNIDDGYLVERHRLQRSDLAALIGVEGYSDDAIKAVLDEYGRGGLHDWVLSDTSRAQAEGKSTLVASTNPSLLIDALQFWGSVQGRLLVEWGMSEKEVPDELKEYNIEVWLIGTWIIKAAINSDPLGRKPYYKASYEEIPGAFWGNSVADLCRDTQDICNATARALVNNMSIASGPQVVYNVDRLPAGENITQMFPWKTWQVTSDPTNGTAPPMQFFQPQTMAQELLTVYDKFSVLADEYTGIPRYMSGDAPSGGAGRTASGMSMLMSNAGKSIKQVIANVDVHVTEPAIGRLYFYNMRYGTDPDLKGDVNIVASGAEALMTQEQSAQRRNEFLQMATTNQVIQSVVGREGIAAVLREVAKGLGMNTDDIVPPIEILKQRWAQQAAAAQQAQAAQAQGPQGPQGPGPQGPGPQGPGPQGQPPGPPSQLPQVLPPHATMTGEHAGPGQAKKPPPPGNQLQTGAPVTNNFTQLAH